MYLKYTGVQNYRETEWSALCTDLHIPYFSHMIKQDVLYHVQNTQSILYVLSFSELTEREEVRERRIRKRTEKKSRTVNCDDKTT